MVRGSLVLAAAVGLVGTSAQAQVNHGASPTRFNSPTSQAGMYNNSPALRYNNPLNQAGMYYNNPVLQYNNPLNQAGMYYNSPVLQYNNPYYQTGGYANGSTLGFNNPYNQTGMYNNSAVLQSNNPYYQGRTTNRNVRGAGTNAGSGVTGTGTAAIVNPAVRNSGNNVAILPPNAFGVTGAVGGGGGFFGSPFSTFGTSGGFGGLGFGNPFLMGGLFNGGLGGFGNAAALGQAGFLGMGMQNANPMLMGNAGLGLNRVPAGSDGALVGSGKVDPSLSSILNGTGSSGKAARPKASTKARRRSSGSRSR